MLRPEDGPMPFTSGGDWSFGVNSLSRDSPAHAELLAPIGQRLREVYTDVLREPLPDRFAAIIERLDDERKRDTHRTARRAG